MTIRKSAFLVAAALVALPCPAALLQAQPAPQASRSVPVADAKALAGFDQFIAETIAKWNVPGIAVAIVRDGRVVLSKGYGVRDIDSGAPVTKDTIFPLASVTKSFLSFDVGLLIDEGKLDLDAPIRTYLPTFTLKDSRTSEMLTLRDILSHRSGMPRHDGVWYLNGSLSREDLLSRVPYLDATAPLRTKFQYNNLMYGIASLAVERAAGENWEAFTARRVFDPLGMKRTAISDEWILSDPNHMKGADERDGKLVSMPMPRLSPAARAGGGIYSTVDDLTRWMNLALSGKGPDGKEMIKARTLAELQQPQMLMGSGRVSPEGVLATGWALGWETELYRGERLVSHGGNVPGVSTDVALLPDRNFGVAVLVNRLSQLPTMIAQTVIDRFLDLAPIDWSGKALEASKRQAESQAKARASARSKRVTGTQPSHKLADYVGDYADPGYGTIRIRLGQNGLTAQINDEVGPLEHWHYDIFSGMSADPYSLLHGQQLLFTADFDGKISGVQTRMEPTVPPIQFKRVQPSSGK